VIWSTDIRNTAYALATIYHETAGSMQPVEEGYYLGKRAKAFQKTLRYYPYYGRGYVQLTWKTNYQNAGQALGIDLVNHPEKALEHTVAFNVLTLGMFRGWFSKGNTLGKYIHGSTCDYRGARRIINGTDKAGLIAGYAEKFEQILKVSVASPTLPNSGALIENATPIPGIRPAGNVKTYNEVLVSNHLVEIHMGKSFISDKPQDDHLIGSFKMHEDRVDFALIEPLWSKFKVNKATLLFELSPDFEKTITG